MPEAHHPGFFFLSGSFVELTSVLFLLLVNGPHEVPLWVSICLSIKLDRLLEFLHQWVGGKLNELMHGHYSSEPWSSYGPNKQDLELERGPLPASPGCQRTRRQCWHKVWAGVGTGALQPWGRRRTGQCFCLFLLFHCSDLFFSSPFGYNKGSEDVAKGSGVRETDRPGLKSQHCRHCWMPGPDYLGLSFLISKVDIKTYLGWSSYYYSYYHYYRPSRGKGCKLPVQAKVPKDSQEKDAHEAPKRCEEDGQIGQLRNLDFWKQKSLGWGRAPSRFSLRREWEGRALHQLTADAGML